MITILCPGMHDEAATASFLRILSPPSPCLTFPAHIQPAYSPHHLVAWLETHQLPWEQGVCFVAFSAGVVGGLGAARYLWRKHIPVDGFIAIDGWGVPLFEPFPLHRLSHDQVTHDMSLLLGPHDGDHFYATPPVDHLTIWRSPHQVTGWRTTAQSPPQQTTAAAFLRMLLHRYSAPVR